MELAILEQTPDYTHVRLAGRLDVMGVPQVETRFLAATVAAKKPAIVDIGEVDFIASLGMGMLVNAAGALRRHGVPMILICAQPTVAQALRMSSIDSIVCLADDIDAACQLITQRTTAG
jgi:anti-anti-sigma factor